MPDARRPSRGDRGASGLRSNALLLRLVARIQSGDRDAFDELYERCFDALHGYLRSLVRRDDVEDVLHRVFERLLEALPRYAIRDDSSVRAWMFRLARNEALDHLGERDRAHVLPPEEMVREIEAQDARHVDMPTINLGWVSDAGLANALRALTPTQRELIVLYYAADLPLKDVATVLGISDQAARQHHRRALATLERRLYAAGWPRGPERGTLPMRQVGNDVSSLMTGRFSVVEP